MASGGGGGGGKAKFPWKLLIIGIIYLFLAKSIPTLAPANIAHSLSVFMQQVSASQGGG